MQTSMKSKSCSICKGVWVEVIIG